MKLTTNLRIWIANKLIKLALWIRPKEVTQLMQAMQDSFIFGTGITVINPRNFFEDKNA